MEYKTLPPKMDSGTTYKKVFDPSEQTKSQQLSLLTLVEAHEALFFLYVENDLTLFPYSHPSDNLSRDSRRVEERKSFHQLGCNSECVLPPPPTKSNSMFCLHLACMWWVFDAHVQVWLGCIWLENKEESFVYQVCYQDK